MLRDHLSSGHRALAVFIVFGSSLLSGTAIVSFPGSSRHLVDTLGLSGEAYGRIFLPQLVFAILGGLVGGGVTRRFGPKSTLGLLLVCQALSMAALFGATFLPLGYAALLGATSLFGFSFGISGGPWSVYPPRLFPHAKSTAIASVYTLFGIGLTAGPLFIRLCTAYERWYLIPLAIGGSAMMLVALLALCPFPGIEVESESSVAEQPPLDRAALVLFLAASFFYATIEAGFANWAVAFLTGDQALALGDAAVALSLFFGFLTAGRLAISVLILKVKPAFIWMLLPPAMGVAFLLLPLASTAHRAWIIYALAGFACSGHFPLSMTLSSTFFETRVVTVSSWMFSALMAGIGLGAYFVGFLSGHTSMTNTYRVLVLSPIVIFVAAISLRKKMTGNGESRPSPR